MISNLKPKYRFGRKCCFKNFKMAAILDIKTELFKEFEISIMPGGLAKFQSNRKIRFRRKRCSKDFKIAVTVVSLVRCGIV